MIQSIHDTLLEFIDNNPDAWAPIVTKVEIFYHYFYILDLNVEKINFLANLF